MKRAHDFFYSKGVKEYYSNYTLEGNTESGNSDHSAGLVACNAVAALASNDIKAWDFVDDLWDTPIPSGRYRYYDGMLYFLGFLHASGNFRIYKPNGGGTTSIPQPRRRNDQHPPAPPKGREPGWRVVRPQWPQALWQAHEERNLRV